MNKSAQLVKWSYRVFRDPIRFSSTSAAAQRRSELFSLEQRRQKDNVGRIEKIEVRYLGLPDDTTLVMNRGISTPYNCAQHLSEGHCKRSALALLDGNAPWDMHRPLQESCTLQLLNFTVVDPHLVNRAFWRTCSFMLGAALMECFKPEAGLQLHSFPGPNLKSGSFVHDIVLGKQGWKPNIKELRTISAEMVKLSGKDIPVERLDISQELALEMFKDNKHKMEQIPSIIARNNGHATVYRIGQHVDISRGPMIGATSFLGRCTITAIHEVGKQDDLNFYRVQGVALPTGIIINHFAFNILEERAKKLNPARLPTEPFEEPVPAEQTMA